MVFQPLECQRNAKTRANSLLVIHYSLLIVLVFRVPKKRESHYVKTKKHRNY